MQHEDIEVGARAYARPNSKLGSISKIDGPMVTITPDPEDGGESYQAHVDDVRVRHEERGEWAWKATITADSDGLVELTRGEQAQQTTVRVRDGSAVVLAVRREDRPEREWTAICLEHRSYGWVVTMQGDRHVRISLGDTGRESVHLDLVSSGPVLARWRMNEPYDARKARAADTVMTPGERAVLEAYRSGVVADARAEHERLREKLGFSD